MFVLLTLLLTTGGAEEVKLESFSPGSPPVDLLVDVELLKAAQSIVGMDRQIRNTDVLLNIRTCSSLLTFDLLTTPTTEFALPHRRWAGPQAPFRGGAYTDPDSQ